MGRKHFDRSKCTMCGITKTRDNTYLDSSKPDGFRTRCVACVNSGRGKWKGKNLVPQDNPVVQFRPQVFERDGKLWTTSLEIARAFGREHKNVLRDVETMHCSQAFSGLNFEPGSYLDAQNQQRPMVEMTRNGWIFLVMGYTGEPAAKIKESYIKRFDEMESALRENVALATHSVLAARDLEQRWVATYEKQTQLLEAIHGDVSGVKTDVDILKTDMVEVKEGLTDLRGRVEKRLKISRSILKGIARYLLRDPFYEGKCPVCRGPQIVELNKGFVPGTYEEEHFRGRSKRSIHDVWVVCKQCHQNMTHHRIESSFFEGKFNAFQQGMEQWYRHPNRRRLYAKLYSGMLTLVTTKKG